jgi:hypothetical protein
MNMFTPTGRLKPDAQPDEFRIRWDLEPYAVTAAMDAWLDLGSEMQSFYADRVRQDVETHHRAMHCTNPSELIGIQAAFWQKAVKDYRAHAGRMAELTARIWFPGPGQPKT